MTVWLWRHQILVFVSYQCQTAWSDQPVQPSLLSFIANCLVTCDLQLFITSCSGRPHFRNKRTSCLWALARLICLISSLSVVIRAGPHHHFHLSGPACFIQSLGEHYICICALMLTLCTSDHIKKYILSTPSLDPCVSMPCQNALPSMGRCHLYPLGFETTPSPPVEWFLFSVFSHGQRR